MLGLKNIKKINLYNFTNYLINFLNIRVCKTTIKKVLSEHPEYPSLATLSDALDDWHVDNIAVKLSKEQLKQIDFPALVQLKQQGYLYFAIVEKLGLDNDLITYSFAQNGIVTESVSKFDEKWTGKTLLLSPNEGSGEKFYEKNIQQERIQKFKKSSVIAGLFLISSLAIYLSNAWFSIPILLTKITGAVLSISLVITEIDKENSFIKKLCQIKRTNCESVLNSPAAKLFGRISLSEIGGFYFIGGIFALFISLVSLQTLNLLYFFAIINLIALPYTFFSIYYQWKVVNQWCLICLGIQVTFWIEFILLFPYLADLQFTNFNFNSINVILGGYFLPLFIWYYTKPIVLKSREARTLKKQLISVKRNTRLFNALLQQQPENEFKRELVEVEFGNSGNPSMTILMVTNLYCSPCSNAHKEVEDLMASFPEELNLVIRFVGNKDNNKNQHNFVALHMITLAKRIDQKTLSVALRDWYEILDYDKWSSKYPIDIDPIASEILVEHIHWIEEVNIEYTPTIFINNRKLPEEFNVRDLRYHIKNYQLQKIINSF